VEEREKTRKVSVHEPAVKKTEPSLLQQSRAINSMPVLTLRKVLSFSVAFRERRAGWMS
jgi:hypothetical protein